VLKDIGSFCDSRGPGASVVRALRDTVRAVKPTGSVIICVSNGHPLPADLAADATIHGLALPNRNEHLKALRKVAKQLDVELDADAVDALTTACLGLTLDQAENIWARMHATGGRFHRDDVDLVIGEKARIVQQSGFLEFIPALTLGDIGGLGSLKAWVEQRQLAYSPEAQRLGLPWPKGMMLVGVQGCGKSLTAKAVAGLWHQPLLRMDVGALMESLVGHSERNLRRALDLAERIAPCVLWIDEIEKGFAGIDGAMDGGTIQRMFGTMLTWMQEKESPVFVLATANRIDLLPPEMLRKGRFDELFFVDLPDVEQRNEIWRIHLSYRAEASGDADLVSRLDTTVLAEASDGYSGAEVAAAVVEGAFSALAEQAPLDVRHMLGALSASPPLSRIRKADIEALRDWAHGRARPAS
jgi:AAA+ superfamily predicted ATPase